MYEAPNETGFPFRITTSGATALPAGNLALLGAFASPGNSTTTAPQVNFYVGTTATNPQLLGTCTLALNAFTRLPAYCSGGLTVQVSNDHVDLTLFWNPAGGGT